MGETQHIFLIPGFFGFINLGRFIYFAHVREYLKRELEGRGESVKIHGIMVPPTSSLRMRARVLHEQIAARIENDPDANVHLIGHSSGGLDARLICTPGCDLGEDVDTDSVVKRVRSLVTICTPHRGTPLASLFSSLLGQQLLRSLSVATVASLRQGRLPLTVVARVSALLARNRILGARGTASALDQLADELIGSLDDGQRQPIAQFFHEMGTDQALLRQITPDSMDVFGAICHMAPGIRGGSVIAKAAEPRQSKRLKLGMSPYAQFTYSVYSWLHRQAGEPDEDSTLDSDTRRILIDAYGGAPSSMDNDGIVPTSSQLWGRLLHAAHADHLDIIGHFDDPGGESPHVDWLTTGSAFRRPEFERTWHAVVDFLLE